MPMFFQLTSAVAGYTCCIFRFPLAIVVCVLVRLGARETAFRFPFRLVVHLLSSSTAQSRVQVGVIVKDSCFRPEGLLVY